MQRVKAGTPGALRMLLFLVVLLALLGSGLGRGGGGRGRPVEAGAPEAVADPDQLVRARMVQVIDGDTLVVAFAGTTSARVRLIGVDAPESVHPTRGVEPYGLAAAAFLKELLPPGTVLGLEFDVDVADSNGRLLAYAYLPDGRMVNEVILASGYGQLYTFPPNVRHVERFLAAQRSARDGQRGLWALPGEGRAGLVEEGDALVPRVQVASVDLGAERVEIWNGTQEAIDLSGWTLVSVRGAQTYTFPEGLVLAPGAAVAVTSGNAFEHRPPASVGWTRQNVWANGGDPAELRDPDGRLVSSFP